MDKSIRVRILGREYPLLVREEDEAVTRDMATYVDAKMQAFKKAHPGQSDLVTAVVAALALAEELYGTREASARLLQNLDADLQTLDDQLARVLP